jgi:hypothetical protein
MFKMDAKITLSFNKDVIDAAKKFAEQNNISLSRLMEFLLRQITSGEYKNLEQMPISNWVSQVAEGQANYVQKSKSNKEMRQEYFERK